MAVQTDTDTSRTTGAKSRSGAGAAVRAKRKAVSLAPAAAEDGDRKQVLSLAGKQIASDLGSRLLLDMLAASGKSMRQVARETGFDVSVLSNIARGRRASGPELWTLVALAEALELDLQLGFAAR